MMRISISSWHRLPGELRMLGRGSVPRSRRSLLLWDRSWVRGFDSQHGDGVFGGWKGLFSGVGRGVLARATQDQARSMPIHSQHALISQRYILLCHFDPVIVLTLTISQP